MPNITSKKMNGCGNDKCGTFAPAMVHPHHGGKPMPGSGGSHGGRTSMAKNQTAKGHAHMHGGKAMPMKGMMRDSDGDYD